MTIQRLIVVAASLVLTSVTSAMPDYEYSQLTETPWGNAIWYPTISADGQRIAFMAGYDYTGGNPDGSVEVYLYENGQITQLTNSPINTSSRNAHITADGEHVVFTSGWDHTGENWDRSDECFVVRVSDQQVTQLTDHPDWVHIDELELSRDGCVAAFIASSDPLGTNPDHNAEVFRLDWTTGVYEQITVTTGTPTYEVAIDDDGSRIVFRARQNLDGSNPNENHELWVWDELNGISALTLSNLEQISGRRPVIDGTGRYVAFESNFDFTAGFPIVVDYDGLYLADTLAGTIVHVSPPGYGRVYQPIMDSDGTFLLFESLDDLLGGSPPEYFDRELFYYDIATGGLSQLTDTEEIGGSFTDEAMRDYGAIARNSSTFVYRNNIPLDPNDVNDGGNIELFVGRASHCDVTVDGAVDGDDIDAFVAALGACIGDPHYLFRVDFDGDGCITPSDWCGCYVDITPSGFGRSAPEYRIEPSRPARSPAREAVRR